MKKWQKECAPRSSSTIICTPTMAGGEYTVMRESDFATEQLKYAMYVIKCILSSLSSITSSSLLVDVRYTRKTFPFQNLECHLQVYFIVDFICYLPMNISSFWRIFKFLATRKRKRGETLLLWSRIENKNDEKLIMNNNNDG